MKARQITKITIHLLKSKDFEKGLYHFALNENGIMLNDVPIYSASKIDYDQETLHYALIGYTEVPKRIYDLNDTLGYADTKVTIVGVEFKKKKKNEDLDNIINAS